MSKFRRRLNKEEGFTLVELLIVVAILGILIALAVPRMSGISVNARQKVIDANVRALKSAATMFYVENPDLKGTRNWTGSLNEGWDKYLQEWPKGPGDVKYRVEIKQGGSINVTAKDDNSN